MGIWRSGGIEECQDNTEDKTFIINWTETLLWWIKRLSSGRLSISRHLTRD